MLASISVSSTALAQSAEPSVVQPFVRNWTRFELWRYFEPAPTGGDPSTDYVSNRLQAGFRLRRRGVEANVAIQYTQFGGLPANAIGPGALGTGALYFDHSGEASSRQVYLKTANLAFRKLAGPIDLQIGRMPYTSGAERASGVPRIEAVKRQRIDARLIGEFEWSLYQRAFDGIRVDWSPSQFQLTASAFRPTQGGFEDAAGVTISGVDVFSAALTTKVGALIPRSEVQVFGHRYRDDRPVSGRPDNSGRQSAAADVGVTTIGGHVVGTWRAGAGEIDTLVWTAGQFGSWYEQEHRAFASAVEAGYQWTDVAGAPWVRGGYSWLSGDDVAQNRTHGTFFPMLPTVRRYAQSTLYSLANLRDAFGQVLLRPLGRLGVRVDVHALSLGTPADGWYAGSGATQESGRIFGYSLRRSGGASRLMEVIESSIDWRFTPYWSVNSYVGVASRGPVVRASFAGGPAVFWYVENVVQLER